MPIKKPNGGKANVTETLITAVSVCTWRDGMVIKPNGAERFLWAVDGVWFLEPDGGQITAADFSLLQNGTANTDGSFDSGEGVYELRGVEEWATAVAI